MNDDKLTNIEKQLILYTKHHFKRIDYDNDLKYFAVELYGLYPEQVEKYSILNMVVDVYQKLIDLEYIELKLNKFIDIIFQGAWMRDGKISKDDLIKRMLGVIQETATGDLLKDLKADHSIIKYEDCITDKEEYR